MSAIVEVLKYHEMRGGLCKILGDLFYLGLVQGTERLFLLRRCKYSMVRILMNFKINTYKLVYDSLSGLHKVTINLAAQSNKS